VQVWEDMTEQGILPITQHFVTFLGACCGAPLSAREIQQAFARSLAFCGASGGDCCVYSALLKFCVAQDIPEKATDVWRAVLKVRHTATFCLQYHFQRSENRWLHSSGK